MAIYDRSTFGVLGNQIVFNDDTLSPTFRVQRRRPSNRDVRNFDTPLPEDNGIADFKTLLGRTDYILEGRMYPSSDSEYEQGRRDLRKLADVYTVQNDILSDQGYVPYVWSETDQDKQLMMKALFVDLVEDSRQGLVQPFKIYCKVKYPIIRGATLRIADTGSQPAVITGYVKYSLLYPAVLGKNFYAISASSSNLGDIAAYPEAITVVGPVNRPKVTCTTTGEYIEVDVNLGSSSNQLTMQYDQDTISVTLDGVSVYDKVVKGSSFFKIPPGDVQFQLTGGSISSGAYGRVTFYDAYPLS